MLNFQLDCTARRMTTSGSSQGYGARLSEAPRCHHYAREKWTAPPLPAKRQPPKAPGRPLYPAKPPGRPPMPPTGSPTGLAGRPRFPAGGLTRAGLKLIGRMSLPIGIALEIGSMLPAFRKQGGYNMAGWTLKCDHGVRPGKTIVYVAKGAFSPNLNCDVSARDVPDFNFGEDIHHNGSNFRWISFGEDNSIGVAERMGRNAQWTRPSGRDPVAFSPDQWGNPPDFEYPPWPQIDPFDLPILKPSPQPRPMPYKAIPKRSPNPWRDPLEQPGPGIRNPVPRPARPKPSPVRPPKYKPDELPADEWVIPDEGPAPPRNPYGKHKLRPPTPRERERKVILTPLAASRLGRWLSAATEFADLSEVAFDSLSEDVKRGHWYDSPTEKLALVVYNLDSIRPNTFMHYWLYEQAEDMAYGALGKLGAKAQREVWEHLGANVRPELGPGDTPPQAYEPSPRQTLEQWLRENGYLNDA